MRRLSKVIENRSDVISEIVDVEYPKSITDKMNRNRDVKLTRLRNNSLKYIDESDVCIEGPLWNEK